MRISDWSSDVCSSDLDGIEFRTYAGAVMRELQRIGYVDAASGGGPGRQVATLSIERNSFRPGRDGSPVSVGVGGSTGSYGSGDRKRVVSGKGVYVRVELGGPRIIKKKNKKGGS